jgi:hypothetical protein
VPSARQPAAKPAATIVNATARTRSVIENLQARLTADARSKVAGPQPVVDEVPSEESVDDLEMQLQAYFDHATHATPRTKILDELRSRVIDGVVDRILAEWTNPQAGSSLGAGLGPEVMERLIERVLDEFRNAAEPSKTGVVE